MNEQVKAVQRMQAYIEAHLEQEITLGQLSKASLFSPWYAHRLFKSLVGYTPAEYIRRLRLSRSAMRLKNEKCHVIDAAYECGFTSVDGYTRAFYKAFGCTPGEYARDPVPITLFIPYGILDSEITKEDTDMQNVQSVFLQVVRKPKRKVILKRGISAEHYFDYCAEVGCDVWGLLMSMDSLCGEPVCLWLPKAYQKPHTSTYVQGVEVESDYAGKIPEGFEEIDLPAATYLMAQGEPFEEQDYEQAIVNVQHALNCYNPTFIGYEWDDENPRIQLEPRSERGYVELRAIKKRDEK